MASKKQKALKNFEKEVEQNLKLGCNDWKILVIDKLTGKYKELDCIDAKQEMEKGTPEGKDLIEQFSLDLDKEKEKIVKSGMHH